MKEKHFEEDGRWAVRWNAKTYWEYVTDDIKGRVSDEIDVSYVIIVKMTV